MTLYLNIHDSRNGPTQRWRVINQYPHLTGQIPLESAVDIASKPPSDEFGEYTSMGLTFRDGVVYLPYEPIASEFTGNPHGRLTPTSETTAIYKQIFDKGFTSHVISPKGIMCWKETHELDLHQGDEVELTLSHRGEDDVILINESFVLSLTDKPRL